VDRSVLQREFGDLTLAELYDPLTMPGSLSKAHQTLGKALDAAYGKSGLTSDAARVAFVFDLYRQVAVPLDMAGEDKPSKVSKNVSA
jgi:hypothetical protein